MSWHPLIIIGLFGVLLSACAQASLGTSAAIKRGEFVYAKECSQCHGSKGEGGNNDIRGPGTTPLDLTKLAAFNGGAFPRDFVRRYVMGVVDKDDIDTPMPDFAVIGLRHVYPDGGADGEVLGADFEDLLDYLEAIQK